jgi:hypothetical protein
MSNDHREPDWNVCPELRDPSYVNNQLAQIEAQDKAVAGGCDFILDIPDTSRFMELSTLFRQFNIDFSTFIPTIPHFSSFIYLNRGQFTDKLLEAIGQVNGIRSNTKTQINQAASSDSSQEPTNDSFDFVAFFKLIDLLNQDYISRTIVTNLTNKLRTQNRPLFPYELDMLANLLNK